MRRYRVTHLQLLARPQSCTHTAVNPRLSGMITAPTDLPVHPKGRAGSADVGWRAAGHFFVAEVKSCTNANVEKQLRLGLGQELRYRLSLRMPLIVQSWPSSRWRPTWQTLLGTSSVIRLACTLSSHRVRGPGAFAWQRSLSRARRQGLISRRAYRSRGLGGAGSRLQIFSHKLCISLNNGYQVERCLWAFKHPLTCD